MTRGGAATDSFLLRCFVVMKIDGEMTDIPKRGIFQKWPLCGEAAALVATFLTDFQFKII